ncbi:hypothetical protein ISN76_03535 [Dyella halodurans]|uniref:Uncharacterized protein n=1 Tax=Dyella halodurans TaxID=1920171 RepID=A0ABV9BX26_9GAMM|nr:hypothetical protein [Dyella halodurans]
MTAWLAGTQDSDGVLTALISTQKLTWYFWGQDRLLNLLPALAAPFRDPELNLRVQVFLRFALAFLSPLGVVCVFRGSWRFAVLLVATTQCLLAFALSQYGAFNMWAQHNPYGTSFVLFALALWVCVNGKASWRWGAAFFVLFLAYAVNLALVVWAVPFLAVAMVFGVRDRRLLGAVLLLNLVSILAAWLHSQWFGEPVTKFALHPSWEAVQAGYQSFFNEVDVRLLCALFVAAVVVAAIRRSRETMMAILVAIGMFVAIGALSCLQWLQDGVYSIRYFLTFLTVFVSCCVYILLREFPLAFGSLRRQAIAAAALFFAMFSFAFHGLSQTPWALVGEPWRESSEAAAHVAVDAHAALIVGDFWHVWPAVMEARSQLRRTGQARERMYGMTFRAHALREKIDRLFADRPHGVLSLCLQASVDDCVKTTNSFGQLARPVVADASSIRPVTIAGTTAYLVVLRPTG